MDASTLDRDTGTAFDRDTAVTVLERRAGERPGATFAAEIPERWRAGRGPHGGYLAALILRALSETVADDERAPRSLTIHYASSPQAGAVELDTTIERHGRSLSTVSARLRQDGATTALALAAFSVAWEAPDVARLPLPGTAPPDGERRYRAAHYDGAPPFTQNVVLQPRIGAIPFVGADAPLQIGGWIGLPEPRAVDALALAMFADAWFPPSFIALSEPAISPTVDLTIHFRRRLPDAAADPADMCFSLFQTHVLHEGFFEEDGVIWSAAGDVLAQSRQLGIVMPSRVPPFPVPARGARAGRAADVST